MWRWEGCGRNVQPGMFIRMNDGLHLLRSLAAKAFVAGGGEKSGARGISEAVLRRRRGFCTRK